MTIQNWSDNIIVAELVDDPQFTDEMVSLTDIVKQNCVNVVINLSAVSHMNSSNLSALLRLRKRVLAGKNRIILCGIDTRVRTVFSITGLDKVFEFADDTATALASIQIAAKPDNAD
ncbi:MAG: STAS domain-containing protein [Planctomycetota bacterium]|nr:STAS domain-containing protein [Planctomycetota bacterium]